MVLFHSSSWRSRSGFTLVELLVVLAIVGLLVALLLPAVQHVRESTRRTDCLNRLRQVGLAGLSHESQHGTLPAPNWLVNVSPYLEMRDFKPGPVAGAAELEPLTPLLCPSDVRPSVGRIGAYSNYLANSGVWFYFKDKAGPFVYPDGQVPPWKGGVAMSEIRDGTSRTAFFGEVIRAGPGRLEAVWNLPGPPYDRDEFDKLLAAQASVPQDPAAYGWMSNPTVKGRVVTVAPGPNGEPGLMIGVGMAVSFYNHGAAPQTPACFNGSSVASALIPPSSHHGPVVNIAFCDGHVESISSDMDLVAWHALGSRSGGD